MNPEFSDGRGIVKFGDVTEQKNRSDWNAANSTLL
jgi:hypothetical protein